MPTNKILVVGGAGYVGSHMVRRLIRDGFHPIVLDNLSSHNEKNLDGIDFVIGDLSDVACLEKLFSQYHFSAVMHFASFIDVRESVEEPLKYYLNNVAGSIRLLAMMQAFSINHFIFSSSAAVYGYPTSQPIKESELLSPISPYGRSKLMFEQILIDQAQARPLSFGILRYFNAAGANVSEKLGESHTPETHLIPNVLQVALGRKPFIVINGNQYATKDGTCIRDYVHVEDICEVHLLVLKAILRDKENFILNIGSGTGASVLEVINTAKKVTHRDIPFQFGPPRPGDPPILVADCSLLKKVFNWKPRHPQLETIIDSAWIALNESTF